VKFLIEVKVSPMFEPDPEILEFLKRVKVRVYGKSVFDRFINLEDKYVKLFYVQKGMALVGVEDLDEGCEPDGWTDCLLPIFYGVAPNRGNVDYPIIFVDAAMSGAYTKELYLYSGGVWRRILYYSVKTGLRFNSPDGALTSVGYIEYDLKRDVIYHPMQE
jgi:hypothetical protein